MIIRTVKIEDAKVLADIYAYYVENYSYSFEYEAPSVVEFIKRITEIADKYPFFVCENENGILGFAYAHAYKERKAYQWVCETSIYVKQGHEQKGVGSLLYKKLLPALKKQGFVKVFAVLGCPNIGSERFHQKMGFSLLATFPEMGYKFGCWHDIKYYVKQLNPIQDKLDEPLLYSQINPECNR